MRAQGRAVLLSTGAGALGGCLAAGAILLATPPISAARHAPATRGFPVAEERRLPGSFAAIVKRVLPAVVSIRVVQAQPAPAELRQLGVAGEVVQGLGSGFFISDDGYIVTNYHVAGEANGIAVTLNDGRQLKARLVGRDKATDLALLKVEGRNFPFVSFAESATPQVGDWVVAVGSPFGLGGTATAGIVSAYGRDIGQPWVSYLQLDAPINSGNSGGPTFDETARVIGVNTAIFSPSGGSVGIGFAIPADLARRVVSQLKTQGRVIRGYLGATVAIETPAGAPARVEAPSGHAVIAGIDPYGPAARAGLAVGDLVTELNAEPVQSGLQLMRRIAEVQPGDHLRLTIVRGGRRFTVNATAAERPG